MYYRPNDSQEQIPLTYYDGSAFTWRMAASWPREPCLSTVFPKLRRNPIPVQEMVQNGNVSNETCLKRSAMERSGYQL